MTVKDAESKFREIGGDAFITVGNLSNQDRLLFLEYVKNRKLDVFDSTGETTAFILYIINLFNNNPEDFKDRIEKAKQAQQLKLL